MSLLRENTATVTAGDTLRCTHAINTSEVNVQGNIFSTAAVTIPTHVLVDSSHSPTIAAATSKVLVNVNSQTITIAATDEVFLPNSPGLFVTPLRGAPLEDLVSFKPMLRDQVTAELVYNTLGESISLTFLRQEHVNCVNDLLQYIVTVASAAPTTTSRLCYLLAMLFATAWNLVSPSINSDTALPPTASGFPSTGTIRGSHDNWDFDLRYPQSSNDATVWVVWVLSQYGPTIIPGYDTAALLARERALFNWTVLKQDAATADVLARVGGAAFSVRWQAWWASRASDGYNDPTTGAYVATSADLPNINTPLVVDSSADPGNSGQWTPLQLPGKTAQKYLGYKWDEVRSTCLEPADELVVAGSAAPYFIPHTDPARNTEVHDVYVASASLSDAQKMSAEFWAGGLHTCTPPGMFAWLWADYVRHFVTAPAYQSTSGETDAQALAFLQLSVNLFEGSRLVWRVKSQYSESRPIQEVRNRFRGTVQPDPVSGVPTDASLWVPYQMPNFVTPRFADFPSGHTYFAACFASTMTHWFGANIDAANLPVVNATYTSTNLTVLTPLFSGAPDRQTSFGTFFVAQGGSEVQPGVAPAGSVTLDWSASTWTQLADDVGLSRFYGGIHAMSAYYGSQALANALTPLLHTKWEISSL
jgi:hypothetical protein